MQCCSMRIAIENFPDASTLALLPAWMIPLVLLMKPTPEKLRFPVYVSLLCLATRAVRIAVVHCNSSAKMYRSNWNAFRWPPGYPIRGS
jgi:hypothetical protein